jgi:hypothetical protein
MVEWFIDNPFSAIVVAIVLAMGGWIVALLKGVIKRARVADGALRALLEESLINKAEMYLRRGYITIYERQNFFAKLAAYLSLGGIKDAEVFSKRIEDLPHEPTERKD